MDIQLYFSPNGFDSWKSSCLFFLALLAFVCFFPGNSRAQMNNDHLLLSASALYERGLDASVAYEHSGKYHRAWEYFAAYYIKYEEDPYAGHVTKKSFWHSFNSWHVGIAYKPCVTRGRNHHGNVRIGASAGSDLSAFRGGFHVGYEHSYALKGGWELFFRVNEDVVFQTDDVFRTGVSLGVKCPL